MSVIFVGKWCGYCGKFVEDREHLAHLDICEADKVREIQLKREMKYKDKPRSND